MFRKFKMKKLLVLAVIVGGIAYYSTRCCHQHERPFQFPDDTVWGRSAADSSIKPFTAKFDPKDIEDLKQRIANWRRHEPLEGVGRFYGFAGENLDNLVKYWREKYDFSKLEAKLNSIPQFTTVIQGLKVHFLHAKADASAKTVVPLLLVHGWPGSVVEFYRAIPLLTKPDENGLAFEVVSPSIPGFGFSEAASKPGFNALAAAQVAHALMQRLGHKKFIYQGGDWGSQIGNLLVRVYPESVIGMHVNMLPISVGTLCEKLHLAAAFLAPKLVLGEQGARQLAEMKFAELLLEESGYFHIQATKPDTLGVGLSDSPVGLLAWVAEKFEIATEHAELKGHKGQGISNDDLLTNINLYWLTNHVTSAGRFYKEFVQQHSVIEAWNSMPVTVPAGVGCYPNDIPCSPKALITNKFPRLLHYEEIQHGGHFAAMEEPVIFAADFRAAARKFLAAQSEDATKQSK